MLARELGSGGGFWIFGDYFCRAGVFEQESGLDGGRRGLFRHNRVAIGGFARAGREIGSD